MVIQKDLKEVKMFKKIKYADLKMIKYLMIGILFIPAFSYGDIAFTRYDTSKYFPVDVEQNVNFLTLSDTFSSWIWMLILIVFSVLLISLCKIITAPSRAEIDETENPEKISEIKKMKKKNVILVFVAILVIVGLFYCMSLGDLFSKAKKVVYKHKYTYENIYTSAYHSKACRDGWTHNWIQGQCTECGLKKSSGGRKFRDDRDYGW